MGNYFSKNSVELISIPIIPKSIPIIIPIIPIIPKSIPIIPKRILIPKYIEADQSPPICINKYRVREPDCLLDCFTKNCHKKHIVENNDKFLYDRYMK